MSTMISGMTNLIGVAALSPLLVAGGMLVGCGGGGDPGGGGGSIDKDGGIDVIGKDAPSDTVEEGDAGDATIDPCARTGVNASYFTCDLGEGCSLIDIDISDNPIIRIMAGRPFNRMGLIDIDENDPMGMNAPASADFGMAAEDRFFIGTQFNGYDELTPIQVADFDPDNGIHIVPFSYLGALSGQPTTLSGIAFLDAMSAPAEMPALQGISPKHPGSSLDLNVVGMQGGVRFEGENGMQFGTAMYVANSKNGVFVPIGFDHNGELDQSKPGFPVFLSGTYSGPVAKIDATHVAVLNPAGGVKPNQIDEPSIDIINVAVSAAASSETAAEKAKEARIPLGADVEFLPFPELPISDDGRYAFLVGGAAGGEQLTTLYVIDLQEHTIASKLDLSTHAKEVLGIDVRGDKVAMTVHGIDRRDAKVDDVLLIDIADAAKPKVEKVFAEVGYGLGSIAMHETSGKLYLKIAASAPWCKGPVAEDASLGSIISLDPELAEYASE